MHGLSCQCEMQILQRFHYLQGVLHFGFRILIYENFWVDFGICYVNSISIKTPNMQKKTLLKVFCNIILIKVSPNYVRIGNEGLEIIINKSIFCEPGLESEWLSFLS